jgi:hypothetical protein
VADRALDLADSEGIDPRHHLIREQPSTCATPTEVERRCRCAPTADLVCASGLAKIGIVIGAVNPPANGPQGAGQLVLLEDQSGQWVIANDTLCNSAGQPTRQFRPSSARCAGVQ